MGFIWAVIYWEILNSRIYKGRDQSQVAQVVNFVEITQVEGFYGLLVVKWDDSA